MSLHKQLKTAADHLETQAAAIETSHKELVGLRTKLAAAAAGSVAQTKTASAEAEAKKAKLAGLAKTAAERVRAAGLLSSSQQADAFAAQILDPEVALAKIAALTEHVKMPKTASVVADTAAATPSATESWDRRVAAYAARLPVR